MATFVILLDETEFKLFFFFFLGGEGGGAELFPFPYPLKVQARPPQDQRLGFTIILKLFRGMLVNTKSGSCKISCK